MQRRGAQERRALTAIWSTGWAAMNFAVLAPTSPGRTRRPASRYDHRKVSTRPAPRARTSIRRRASGHLRWRRRTGTTGADYLRRAAYRAFNAPRRKARSDLCASSKKEMDASSASGTFGTEMRIAYQLRGIVSPTYRSKWDLRTSEIMSFESAGARELPNTRRNRAQRFIPMRKMRPDRRTSLTNCSDALLGCPPAGPLRYLSGHISRCNSRHTLSLRT